MNPRPACHVPPCCRRRGVTLVELLIAVIVSAILLTGMGFVLEASLTNYEVNERIADVNQVARAMTERIARDLRQAEDASISGSSLTIVPVDDGFASSITYRLETDGSFTYEIVRGGTTETYTLFNATDDLRIGSFEPTVIEENIDGSFEPVLGRVVIVFVQDGEDYRFYTSGSPRINH